MKSQIAVLGLCSLLLGQSPFTKSLDSQRTVSSEEIASLTMKKSHPTVEDDCLHYEMEFYPGKAVAKLPNGAYFSVASLSYLDCDERGFTPGDSITYTANEFRKETDQEFVYTDRNIEGEVESTSIVDGIEEVIDTNERKLLLTRVLTFAEIKYALPGK